ncbi:uncharacterized protein E0L32_009466 [Thyridium curvatum]|uniref:Uncharacterized protein n=1 Tax=Thyridium curvatum TaxID=1093900 RepID=A0A507ARX4_9PEZI|nr:uncharacterized protein E0L32_009466 [Thyridium curvatum]TPX09274.1 hypothetical protein E0L32_009466 [Thyridium curvatum]
MTSPSIDGHRPPSRTASFQRMLDLEKKYKLARLQRTHTSPSTESQESIQTRPPIQARRRDSLTHQQGQIMLDAVRKNTPFPSLSIKIPPADTGSKKESEQALSDYKTDEVANESRDKSVTFLAPDDDEISISEQSSICHSPSWEGWGQQKKKKKEQAEQRKRDKEQAEKDVRIAKKRLANRLSKAPPPPDSQPLTETRPGLPRSASTSMVRQSTDSKSTNSSISSMKPPASTQTFVPYWGFAVTSAGFVGGIRLHQPMTLPLKALEPASTKAKIEEVSEVNKDGEGQETASARRDANVAAARKAQQPTTVTDSLDEVDARPSMQKSHTMAMEPKYAITTSLESPRTLTMPDSLSNDTSYPPPSSRSRMLRHMPPGNVALSQQDSRQARSGEMDETSRFAKAQNMKSSQSSRTYTAMDAAQAGGDVVMTMNDRGRRRGNSASYVQNARDRSTERAMAGLMDEAMMPIIPMFPDVSKESNNLHPSQGRKQGQGRSIRPETGSRAAPESPTGSVDGTHEMSSEDYFNFVNNTYDPPELGLSPPPASLFASIKAKMSRQSSSSSSAPSTIRSSTERIKTFMHPPSRLSSRNSPETQGSPDHIETDEVSPISEDSPIPGGEDALETPRQPPVSAVLKEEPRQSQTTARPSEGSSTSSYHDDSSVLSSPAGTPDTSRPQSARGVSTSLEPAQLSDIKDGAVTHATDQLHPATQVPTERSSSNTLVPRRDDEEEDMTEPPIEPRYITTNRPATRDKPLSPLASPGLRHLMDEDWSRSRMPLDVDDVASSLSNVASSERLQSAPAMPHNPTPQYDMTLDGDRTSSQSNSTRSEPQSRADSRASNGKQAEDSKSHHKERKHRHKGEKKRSSREKDMERPSSSRSQPLLTEEPGATDVDFLPPLKHEPITHSRPRSRDANLALQPAQLERDARAKTRSPLTVPTGTESSGRSSPSAAYLAEARRTAPTAPSSQASSASSRSLPKPATSSPAVTATRPILRTSTSSPAPAVTASRAPLPLPQAPLLSTAAGGSGPGSGHSTPPFRVPAQEPEQLARPMAKMLVECCSCRFLHDMPSRVYECMAQPNAVVTDRSLGVSGAITTMVKCPWCAHNMSTQCCAGYAAVVYLKERLH